MMDPQDKLVFSPGQPVIYLPTTPDGKVYKVEYGIVKRMSKDGRCAFVWYHSGCTAASTPIEYLQPTLMLDQHKHCHQGCPQCFNEPDIEFQDDQIVIGDLVIAKVVKK